VSTKAQQRRRYRVLPPYLKRLREEAELTQRELGARLKKPQSWIYNCETSNRRVDISEFIDWVVACDVDPETAFERLLEQMR